MPTESPLRSDDLRLLAWEKYIETSGYANAAQHVTNAKHKTGSLWAVFLAGFEAGKQSSPSEIEKENENV